MKGYRCGTGFTFNGTAADVVRYEEEELGNDLRVPASVRPKLDNLPASAIAWVCLLYNDALRYGLGEEIVEVEFAEVVSNDGEGGYLVVLRQE